MAGIYIHIPFCKQKCTYCDFHFSTTFADYRQNMVDSIIEEIKTRAPYLQGKSLNTIYFGGGTPSILNGEELEQILKTIHTAFTVNPGSEISLEANPDDITDEKLRFWTDNGINRLSIGLQSFKAEDLKWMNRAHTVDEALACVSKAQKAGINNLTVDLIYGLPGLSMEEWEVHVQQVIDFGVAHVSAYCLTVEENTTLNSLVKKGKIIPANEDQQSEQFQMLISILEKNGLEQYEISNFAKSGFESKHNSNYWKGEWYLGVGPSAHSFDGISRSWNVANNQKYMKAIASKLSFNEVEVLSPHDQFNEYVLIGLRTVYGVKLEKLNSINTVSEEFMGIARGFEKNGWMNISNEELTLTREGRLKADYIASELFLID